MGWIFESFGDFISVKQGKVCWEVGHSTKSSEFKIPMCSGCGELHAADSGDQSIVCIYLSAGPTSLSQLGWKSRPSHCAIHGSCFHITSQENRVPDSVPFILEKKSSLGHRESIRRKLPGMLQVMVSSSGMAIPILSRKKLNLTHLDETGTRLSWKCNKRHVQGVPDDSPNLETNVWPFLTGSEGAFSNKAPVEKTPKVPNLWSEVMDLYLEGSIYDFPV
ncbi:hypothetical protein AVEN_256734-1 [Araneus ventricosus]|uniref:Uncharacterized protein n=1 Tax=Araneus ventricosus TaxID=182803 RepID=A0A4Y2FQU5_ARAVE|nr:hypothetical protein AVEN_256734-1 [Araneus ventricosus]